MTDRVEKGDEFTCSNCGGVFNAAREHDDAVAECDENFGPSLAESIVCDDCYKEIMAWSETLPADELKVMTKKRRPDADSDPDPNPCI